MCACVDVFTCVYVLVCVCASLSFICVYYGLICVFMCWSVYVWVFMFYLCMLCVHIMCAWVRTYMCMCVCVYVPLCSFGVHNVLMCACVFMRERERKRVRLQTPSWIPKTLERCQVCSAVLNVVTHDNLSTLSSNTSLLQVHYHQLIHGIDVDGVFQIAAGVDGICIANGVDRICLMRRMVR